VEARGTGGTLGGAALAGGFDLRRHENILVSPPTGQPKEIYAGTRVLLVPSLGQDAAPRVIAEALVNGIPPIVSDRGGLAEAANGGGFVVAIPPEVTSATRVPVSAEIAAPWVELILRLTEDDAAYAEASRRASQAGALYRPETLGRRYVDYFNGVLVGGLPA
jgi:glycosyltransferase involved in cell wall biosynthesis